MPVVSAVVECPVHESFRVRQVAGMFDVPLGPLGGPLSRKAREAFSVEIPSVGVDWRFGAIVGPSGSGKTTIAREAFGEGLYQAQDWPAEPCQ